MLLLVLAACVQNRPPQQGSLAVFPVASKGPVSAAEFLVSYDPQLLEFSSIAARDPAVLVRAFDDRSGRLKVALVASSPVQGELLELAFRILGDGGRIGLTDVRTYDHSGVALGPILEEQEARRAASRPVEAVDLQNFPPVVTSGHAGNHLPDLQASFANFVLGDTNQDGVIGVLDVLQVLDIATGANSSPTAYQLYHGDLDGDDDSDVNDVLKLLDKAVDPTLPAELLVKPTIVNFVQLQAGVPVLVGNAGNQPLTGLTATPTAGITASQVAGITGQSAAYQLTTASGWKPGSLLVDAGSAGSATLLVGNLVVLVAGQSNAVGKGLPFSPAEQGIPEVRMLGNDYLWKEAAEPLDSAQGQLDAVSIDNITDHSFGVRLGKDLFAASGRFSYLIPSALGGTRVSQWAAASNPLDRTTLFGSANYRAQTSAGLVGNPASGNQFAAEGGPVTVLAWYQGESDSRSDPDRQDFIQNTNAVMNAFTAQLGVPVIYVQLAAHGRKTGASDAEALEDNLEHQDIGERQRRMETGAVQFTSAVDPPLSSVTPRQDFYMVVTNDLPLSDHIHLSAEGQRLLGDRIALAIREHVLGENVDGTGPRLVSVSRTGKVIRVKTTRTITQDSGNDYEGFFTVFDGPPAGSNIDNPPAYGLNTIAIQDVSRDPVDDTVIMITLQSTPSGTAYVRYMPPPFRPFSSTSSLPPLANVVKGAASGLPLPSFGPIAVP